MSIHERIPTIRISYLRHRALNICMRLPKLRLLILSYGFIRLIANKSLSQGFTSSTSTEQSPLHHSKSFSLLPEPPKLQHGTQSW